MPEIRVLIRWPSGATERCYSPSLVIKDFFEEGQAYPLDDFLTRSRTALAIASDRVRARYGFACSRAESQIQRIESAALAESAWPDPKVTILAFEA